MQQHAVDPSSAFGEGPGIAPTFTPSRRLKYASKSRRSCAPAFSLRALKRSLLAGYDGELALNEKVQLSVERLQLQIVLSFIARESPKLAAVGQAHVDQAVAFRDTGTGIGERMLQFR